MPRVAGGTFSLPAALVSEDTAANAVALRIQQKDPDQTIIQSWLDASGNVEMSISQAGVLTVAGGVSASGVQTFAVDDAARDAVTDVLTLTHTTSDAAHGAAGMGAGILFRLEDGGGNGAEDAARIATVWSDPASGSEDADVVFQMKTAGAALAEKLRLTSTAMLKWGATSAFPAIKRNGAGLDLRLGDDSGYAPLTARGDSFFYIGDGSGQAFQVRTFGDGVFYSGQYVTSVLASGGATLHAGFMRMDETTQLGIRFGFGRKADGTQDTDVFAPSTAQNRTAASFESAFLPTASSPNFAALQVLTTINGTSSGKAAALAVVGKTMTLTGGTKRLQTWGVSTTDYYTGFTEHAFLNDAGLLQVGQGADASAIASPSAHMLVQGSGKNAVTARNTSLDIEVGFWVQGDGNGRMGVFTATHVLQLYSHNVAQWQIDTSGNFAQLNAGQTVTATRFITAGSTTAAYDHADSSVGVGSAASARVRYQDSTKSLQASINGADYIPLLTGLSAYKTADETVTDTTLQNDDHLTVSLAASSKYAFEFNLFTSNAGATEGFKAALGGTVGVTNLFAEIQIWDNTTNAAVAADAVTALGSSAGGGLGATTNYATVRGTIETSTAGTLLLQWAQNATGASAGVTVKRGSCMRVTRLP